LPVNNLNYETMGLTMNAKTSLSIMTLLLMGLATPIQPSSAQTMDLENDCQIVEANIQYARTRIGNFCLFRGSWMCSVDLKREGNC